jgi:tetratricopeptide (TPR) repeat protein
MRRAWAETSGTSRRSSARLCAAALLLASSASAPTAAASSADELVVQARAHEATHEDDIAVRRYSDALTLDPSNAEAWLGLGALRVRLGDLLEAEEDLAAYATGGGDLGALRELAEWFGRDGRTPAQLATWRHLLAEATRLSDSALATEARRMVRALVILVDGADPASSPIDPDPARQAMAHIARRGG